MRLRPILSRAHRWAGLATAGFLTVAGLTGAVIAFNHELDAWLNPELFRVSPTAEPHPALALVAELEAADPRLEATYFPLEAEPGHSLSVFVRGRVDPRTGEEHALDFDQVFVDPTTGAVLGQRRWGAVGLDRKHVIPFLYRLHYTLHLPGTWGPWVMGLVGLVWMVDCVVGFALTLPANGGRTRSSPRRSFWQRWRPAWLVRARAGRWRVNFDLHRASGLWFWPVLFVLAGSGVYLELSDALVRPLLGQVATLTPSPFDRSLTEPAAKGADRGAIRRTVVESARQVAAERGLTPPFDLYHHRESGIWGVGLGDHHAPGLGVPWLYFDSRGTLVQAQEPRTSTAADRALAAMFPLHSGNAFGLPGRVLIAVTGVAVAVLSMTGVLIWARRAFKRRLRERLSVPEPPAVGVGSRLGRAAPAAWQRTRDKPAVASNVSSGPIPG